MSQKMLPEHIDPFRFAEQSLKIEGLVQLSDLHRLKTILNDGAEHDTVFAELGFGIDEQGVNYVKGSLKTVLKLTCQRCLNTFNHEIKANFILGIASNLDEANNLPSHYEPALTKEGALALRELIEDEIILNLPIIPRHDPADCPVALPLTNSDWEESKKDNPFQVLESLKRKKEKL